MTGSRGRAGALPASPAAVLAASSTGCLIVLAVLSTQVAAGRAGRWDSPVHTWFVRHRSGAMTGVMETVTWLGSTAVLIPLLAAAGGYLLWSRRTWGTPLLVWSALAGGVLLDQTGKALFARPRPPAADMLVRTGGYAFPSGHSVQAITGWGVLAVLAVAGGTLRRRIRVAFACISAVVVVLVGTSRLYLGVHWLSDVVGGFLLGAAWLMLLLALRARRGRLGPPPPHTVVLVEGDDVLPDDDAWEDADAS